MPTIFEIPETNLVALTKRVQRYVSRAQKHGDVDIGFRTVEIVDKAIEIPDRFAMLRGDRDAVRTVTRRVARVELDDVKTMLGDWQIVGVKQVRKTNGRLETIFYGPQSVKASLEDMQCDHCKTKRYRSLVYRLRHLDSHEVNVGSTCLSDFIGGDVPAHLVSGFHVCATIAKELSDATDPYWRHGDPGQVIEESRLVMAVANRIIQETGWVTSAAAKQWGDVATWRHVANALELSRTEGGVGLESQAPFGSDFMAADEAIAWINGSPGGDFFDSLRAGIKTGAIGPRGISLLTAGMASYRNHLQRENEREKLKVVAATSEHIGSVGQRIEVIVTIRDVKEFSSQYGYLNAVTMTSPDGDVFTWVTGNPKMEKGKVYEIKGTVKGHGAVKYGPLKGTNETKLSRIVVMGEITNAPPTTSDVDGVVPDEALDTLDNYFSSLSL